MHYSLAVLVPPNVSNVKGYIDEVMAEYDENYHEGGTFDWYRVGGRFDGVLIGDPKRDDRWGLNHGDEFETLERNALSVLLMLEWSEPVFYAMLTPKRWIHHPYDFNDYEDRVIEAFFRTALKQHLDHTVVMVDCHI